MAILLVIQDTRVLAKQLLASPFLAHLQLHNRLPPLAISMCLPLLATTARAWEGRGKVERRQRLQRQSRHVWNPPKA